MSGIDCEQQQGQEIVAVLAATTNRSLTPLVSRAKAHVAVRVLSIVLQSRAAVTTPAEGLSLTRLRFFASRVVR